MAADAEKMGMIYKVAEDANLQTEAMAVATTLAQMPTIGIGLTKRLLNQSMNNTLEEQLMLEAKIQVLAATSNDHKEGIMAFLEKRKANFQGN